MRCANFQWTERISYFGYFIMQVSNCLLKKKNNSELKFPVLFFVCLFLFCFVLFCFVLFCFVLFFVFVFFVFLFLFLFCFALFCFLFLFVCLFVCLFVFSKSVTRCVDILRGQNQTFLCPLLAILFVTLCFLYMLLLLWDSTNADPD